jgi:hypothetical protein
MRNLHVPLPEPLYRRLRAESDRTRRAATEIAREAIERWLSEQRRIVTHAALSAYASESAGTGADLDPALEAAATEHLSGFEETRE